MCSRYHYTPEYPPKLKNPRTLVGPGAKNKGTKALHLDPARFCPCVSKISTGGVCKTAYTGGGSGSDGENRTHAILLMRQALYH